MEIAMPIIIKIIILIFSVVIHEVSHGYAALALGDKTAQYAGRLTLNPIKHIDLFGSILLPALTAMLGGPVFGWAKPVPYNTYNLRNQRWGPAIVGAAGPLANLSIAVIFGLMIRILPWVAGFGVSGQFITNFIIIAGAISLLNLVLAIFNLVPVPPLDGSKVLFALLPYRWHRIEVMLERYGLIILLIFIFFFAQLLVPVIDFFFRIIAGG